MRAHKIRLNPTPEQEVYFKKAAGTVRFVYNWALARWKEQKANGVAEYGPAALKKEFNAIKREAFPWVYEVSKNATRTHHIFTEVSMFSSAKRMAALSADQQKVIRDAAKRAVQVEMWEQNLKEQVAAWNDLAARVKAIPDPDVPSFREKMKPVLENFIKRAPKAQAYIEGTQKAG